MTRAATLLAGLALLLVACDRGGSDLPAPAYGQAACAACGQTISDPHFAAQYRLPDGTVQSFDDPVCLVRSLSREPGAPAAIRFHAFGADAWVPAADAWFASTPAIRSPRGFTWAAFPSFADAQDAVAGAGGGEILPFEQAKARLGAAGAAPRP